MAPKWFDHWTTWAGLTKHVVAVDRRCRLHDRKLFLLGVCTLLSLTDVRQHLFHDDTQRVLSAAVAVFTGLQRAYESERLSLFHWLLCFTQLMIAAFITIRSVLCTPLPSNRHHRSSGDCLEGKRENYQVCSVQHCVQQLCTVNCTYIWTNLTVLLIGFCLTGPISLCVDHFCVCIILCLTVHCMHVYCVVL